MSKRKPSVGFTETVSRAITDDGFRTQLLADPEATVKPLGLSQQDEELIVKIAREKRDHIEDVANQYKLNQTFCVVIEYRPDA